MKKMTKASLALLALLGGIVTQSQAQVTAVTSPGGLPTTDSIGWGQLGPAYTVLSSPLSVVSGGGLTATVTDVNGNFERRDEGNGWAGNFAPGDALLWNQGSGGNITIAFGSPIYGAGAFIQSDDYGAFTAFISAYSGATLLGTEAFNGDSTGANDGSAIFAGLDSASPITSVVFGLTAPPNDDFAIDALDLDTTNVVKLGVPDAGSTSLLFGMASLGLGFFRRKLAKS
jgi:VPDSG-CTERM motif